MKKYIFLLCGMLQIFFLYSSEAENWERGYRLYQREHYQEALSNFLSVKNENTAVLMMISNCYGYLGNLALQKGYQEKAFIVGNFSQRKRLFEMEDLTVRGYHVHPVIKSIIAFLYCVTIALPFYALQWLFLIFLFLFLFFPSHRMGKRRKFLIFVLLFVILFCMKQTYELLRPRGVITISTQLRLVPLEHAQAIKELNSGEIVYILTKRDDFCKVKTADDKGWVLTRDIFDIV